MGKGSSNLPAPTPAPVVNQASIDSYTKQGQIKQGADTQDQYNPFGSLTYQVTGVDPITGQPKYTAVNQYSPEQQRIFDLLQWNQMGLGGMGNNILAENMGQYANGPIDLSAATNSLSNAAMDPMMANLDRYMTPQLQQKDTELRNQGILPTPNGGNGTYELEMDKVRNNQNLTKGSLISQYFPQAEKMALDQLNVTPDLMAKIMGLSQPGSLPGQLTNTPSFQMGQTDYNSINNNAYQQAVAKANADAAAKNNLIGSILGTTTKLLATPI